MSINKTSISTAASSIAFAKKFDGNHEKLRLKNGVIYTKHLSPTEILAKLGHKESCKVLKQQKDDAKKWVEDSLIREYKLAKPDAIRLSKPNGLTGDQASGMQASAAVAKAAEDLSLGQLKKDFGITDESLTDILTGARRYVEVLDTKRSAEDRVRTAKAYLIERLVQQALPDLPEMKKFNLKLLISNLHTTAFGRSADDSVVRALVNLIWSQDDPSTHQLDDEIGRIRPKNQPT